MLAIEPLRVGRVYWFQPEYVLNNFAPWDYPECHDCGAHVGEDDCPEDIPGDVWHNMTTHQQWRVIGFGKRWDSQYDDICTSLQRFGWLRYPTLRYSPEEGGVVSMGDGHHRVLAALDIGLCRVPMEPKPAREYRSVVSNDSGSESAFDWDVTTEDGLRIEAVWDSQ
jgi:hypothetical protein